MNLHLNKLKITDQEKKLLLAKTESAKVVTNNKKGLDITEQNLPKPSIVRELQAYQIWMGLGKELYLMGELTRAKEF